MAETYRIHDIEMNPNHLNLSTGKKYARLFGFHQNYFAIFGLYGKKIMVITFVLINIPFRSMYLIMFYDITRKEQPHMHVRVNYIGS